MLPTAVGTGNRKLKFVENPVRNGHLKRSCWYEQKLYLNEMYTVMPSANAVLV